MLINADRLGCKHGTIEQTMRRTQGLISYNVRYFDDRPKGGTEHGWYRCAPNLWERVR